MLFVCVCVDVRPLHENGSKGEDTRAPAQKEDDICTDDDDELMT